jgi:hypothetical protein
MEKLIIKEETFSFVKMNSLESLRFFPLIFDYFDFLVRKLFLESSESEEWLSIRPENSGKWIRETITLTVA